MRRTITFVSVIVSSLWLIAAMPAQAQTILTWTNQYQSVLAVNQYNQATGALIGTYTNNAPNSCDMGQPQAMTGWLATGSTGLAITFTVNFLGCNSAAVWTGQLAGNGNFQGLWLLSLAAPVVWNGVSAGADSFTLQSGDIAKLARH